MHMITGSRRANGTIAFFIPQRLATCIAKARIQRCPSQQTVEVRALNCDAMVLAGGCKCMTVLR
jgi:hypothetical protein